MLIRTLFLLAGGATLVSALIAGTEATARIVLGRHALAAMHAAFQTRVAAIESDLAGSLKNGTPYPAAPAETSCVLEQGDGGCAIAVTASSRLEPRSGGGVLQANDAVGEGRIEAVVDVRATGTRGNALAQRRARVVFRTLHAAPWALLSGDIDAAFDTAKETDEPGDDGGMMPAPSSPGSLIDVVYRNARTGAEIPANVWRSATPGPGGEAAWSP